MDPTGPPAPQNASRTQKFRRYRVEAELIHEDGEVRILDLSLGGVGVALEPEDHLAPGDHLTVFLANGNERFGPFSCEVVWVKKYRAGLKFSAVCRISDVSRTLEALKLSPKHEVPRQRTGAPQLRSER